MNEEVQIEEFDWQRITIQVRFHPKRWKIYEETYGYPLAHLEIQTINPKRVPLPITESGYLSHHLAPQDVEDEGGPAAYVRAWLDFAARFPNWQSKQEQSRQLDLF